MLRDATRIASSHDQTVGSLPRRKLRQGTSVPTLARRVSQPQVAHTGPGWTRPEEDGLGGNLLRKIRKQAMLAP